MVVDYYPPSFDGALTVQESIDYWNQVNQLNNLETETMSGSGGVLSAEKFTYYERERIQSLFIIKLKMVDTFGLGLPFVGPSVVNSSEILVEFFLNYA